jgi:polyhydroxyalkanoate synthesis regulator protein
MQMLLPRYLEVSIDSFTKEQEKYRDQMSKSFGVGGFTILDDQVRRNMEMFERAFAMFLPSRNARARLRASSRRTNRISTS